MLFGEIKLLASLCVPNALLAAELAMAESTRTGSSTHALQPTSEVIHYAPCFCFSLEFEKKNSKIFCEWQIHKLGA